MENGEFEAIFRCPFSILNLLAFPVRCVTAAAATEFFELKPVGRGLFILGRHVIAFFALRAL